MEFDIEHLQYINYSQQGINVAFKVNIKEKLFNTTGDKIDTKTMVFKSDNVFVPREEQERYININGFHIQLLTKYVDRNGRDKKFFVLSEKYIEIPQTTWHVFSGNYDLKRIDSFKYMVDNVLCKGNTKVGLKLGSIDIEERFRQYNNFLRFRFFVDESNLSKDQVKLIKVRKEYTKEELDRLSEIFYFNRFSSNKTELK